MNLLKNLWNRLFGSSSIPDKDYPITIEVVPNELQITIDLHNIPVTMDNQSRSGLSFTTQGMTRHHQSELFFVLKTNHTDLDKIPQDPLLFFRQVYRLAQQGHLAQAGNITQFGEKDLWGWKGIVYTQPPVHLRKNLPKDCLCMVLLNLEEVQAVQEYGYTRILSMLGKKSRYYPFPYWTDHYRENLDIRTVNKSSLLLNIRRMGIIDATITKIGQKLHLELQKSEELQQHLAQEGFPSKVPIALLTSLSDQADSCLTWSFSAENPEAITLPDSKGAVMGGCMFMLVGEQEQNSAKLVEDGFALFMTNKEWDAFWQAFKTQKNFELQTAEDFMDFALAWT